MFALHQRSSAVDLNNIGCLLMEIGNFEGALQKLQQAVSIMKTICLSHNSDQSKADCYRRPEQGRHSHLRPMPKSFIGQTPYSEGSSLSTIPFLKDECKCSMLNEMQSPLRRPIGGKTIRIESKICICTGCHETELESVIILYNLGLASAYFSQYHISLDLQEYRYHASLQAFRYADLLLHQYREAGCNMHKADCIYYEMYNQHLVLVHIAVVRSLLETELRSSCSDVRLHGIATTSVRLVELCEMIDKTDMMNQRFPATNMPAPEA